MKIWGSFAFSLVVLVLGCLTAAPAKARIQVGSGVWCEYITWDGVGNLTYHGCFTVGGEFLGNMPGGGGGGGNGSGGSPPPGNGGHPPPPSGGETAPTPPNFACLANFMVNNGLAKTAQVQPSGVWAFGKPQPDGTELHEYSTQSSIPPPGFSPIYGNTAPTPPHKIVIYAAGYSPHPGPAKFIDPTVPGSVPTWDYHNGGFSAFEWAIVTLGHEIAHQTGRAAGGPPGSWDESRATGWGLRMLDLYEQSSTKPCGN